MAEPRTESRKDRGFTLLEVIIAFVIMALILGATFDTFSTGFRQAELTGNYAGAVVRAESQMALIGHAEPLTIGVKTGELDRDYTYRVEINPVGEPQPEEAAEAPYRLYNVVLSVFWGQGDNTRDVTLRSHRLHVTETQ
jgi:general secretion pathway protein I